MSGAGVVAGALWCRATSWLRKSSRWPRRAPPTEPNGSQPAWPSVRRESVRPSTYNYRSPACLFLLGFFLTFFGAFSKGILELQLSLAPNDTRSRKSCLSRHKVDRYFNCAKIRFYNCTRLFRSAHFAVKSSWLCYPFAIFVCAARYGANFWVKYPLWVNQPGQLSLPSLRGR